MRNYYVILILIFCISAGCDPKNTSRIVSQQAPIDSMRIDTPSITNNLIQRSHDSLISKQIDFSNLPYGLLHRINKDNPIHCSLIPPLNSAFKKAYGTTNPNIKQYNLSVLWDKFSQFIQLDSIEKSQDTGMAFFYLVNTEVDNDKYFTYAISKARKNFEKQEIEVVNTEDTFTIVMLTKSTPYYKKIGYAEFKKYQKAYIDNTVVFNENDGNTYNVKSLRHPTASFHEGIKIKQFYAENEFYIDNPDQLRLSFIHSVKSVPNVLNLTDGTSLTINAQTVISQFTEGVKKFCGVFTPETPYKLHALDVGTLCPPECD